MIAKKKSKQQMPFSKTKILQVVGLVVLLIFIAISYFSNSFFLDKIILCSLIIGMVFFAKTLGESNGNEPKSDRRTYTDPT